MEINSSSKPQETENPSPTASPHNNGGSTNGTNLTPPHTPTPKPPISKSHESNPFPTTFVQADTSNFKQVVQMLTGSSNPSPAVRGGGSTGASIPPIKSTAQKKQGFKLYERRNSLKNGLMINTLIPGFSQNSGFSPRKPEILSPSILDFPALVLSPATPLNQDTLGKSSEASPSPCVEEERAIAEKKFYLHPSPRTTPRDSEPRLLPLFPVTSPRVSGTSS
ncbi:hypothetical protein CDL12_23697 [Handroanthus impetiginosus]|uniref:VQ domain-containing protein n=1 Tax=Handroanthus impetiginosus TaxID=429701 RepID=A0A2G9GER2_9LAMI|nr:hypothetical protein CDL12_23697 [Handroanthus impetiginosus]